MFTLLIRTILFSLCLKSFIVSGNEIVTMPFDPVVQHFAVNTDISVDVYVPQSAVKGQRFPTLYVMDSQHYFYSALGYQRSLTKGISSVDVSPQFIVIGINTSKLSKRKTRGEYLNRRSDEVIAMLSKEIIPFVDAKFPTSKRRLYFGWQSAAMIGLRLFNSHPELFSDYLLASAQYVSPKALKDTEKTLQAKSLNHKFYLIIGEAETHTLVGHRSLVTLFEKNKQQGIKWHFRVSDRYSGLYDHHTSPVEALSDGLAWVFEDYPDIVFNSLTEVASFGGVDAIKDYYRVRAKRYGVSDEVATQTKFSLFRHAVAADNLKQFNEFEQALGYYQVIGWHHFFGRFFIKHQRFKRAKEVYQSGLLERPNDHRYYRGLAVANVGLKRLELAITHYHKAIMNAPDDIKTIYQKELNTLMEAN